MKKYFLLSILFFTFSARAIEKKTPSGTTVKDKPGQSQQLGINEKISFTQQNITYGAYPTFGVTPAIGSLPPGKWLIYEQFGVVGASGLTAISGVLSTSATPGSGQIASSYIQAIGANSNFSVLLPTTYISLASSTTFYCQGWSIGASITGSCSGFAIKIGNL